MQVENVYRLNNAAPVFIPRVSIAGFYTTEETGQIMRLVAGDHLLERSSFDVHQGGLSTALNTFPVGNTPDILIIEDEVDLAALDRLADVSAPTTNVIVVGSGNDVATFRKLLRKGVSDYLFTPLTPLLLINAIANVCEERTTKSMGILATFLSAGGGTGGSAIAQNTAANLARNHGVSVILIDFDIAMGTVSLQLDIDQKRSLLDAIAEGQHLDAEALEKHLYTLEKGFKVMSSPNQLNSDAEPDIESILPLLDYARELADFIILDLPPGWGPLHRLLVALSERLFLVSNPSLGGMQNTHNLLTYARENRQNLTEPLLIINNVKKNAAKQVGPELFEKTLKTKPVAAILQNPALFNKATAEGGFAIDQPGAKAFADQIESISQSIIGGKSPKGKPKKEQSIFAKLLGRKGG